MAHPLAVPADRPGGRVLLASSSAAVDPLDAYIAQTKRSKQAAQNVKESFEKNFALSQATRYQNLRKRIEAEPERLDPLGLYKEKDEQEAEKKALENLVKREAQIIRKKLIKNDMKVRSIGNNFLLIICRLRLRLQKKWAIITV